MSWGFDDEISPRSRIHGCWLGKSIGGTLGLPVEGVMERLHLTFYDPIPTEAPPNDDLELQLVWLDLLERCDLALTQEDFADSWLAHIHYMWDEYGHCRWNLRRGVPLSDVGTFENPFESGMGSPIRSEIWACIANGRAEIAARYAALDASLDHGPEGIAGEIFLAVMQTLIMGGGQLQTSLRWALGEIDPNTDTARAIRLVVDQHAADTEVWACRDRLLQEHGSENFTHAPLNVGLIAWALLYGGGEFEKSVLLAVNGGYDTDCTGATVGATLGLLLGREGIPPRWSQPIGEGVAVGPGLVDTDAPKTLGELSKRVHAIAERMVMKPPKLLHPADPTRAVDLASLPGTLQLQPIDGTAPVLWANGELPDAVKRAGGATWEWHTGESQGQPHHLMTLAKAGARLFVDGALVVDCPPGLPFVPAPHRCPSGCQTAFIPTGPVHQIRLELGSTEPAQQATSLLSAANFHLAPWSGEALPYPPQLDPPAE